MTVKNDPQNRGSSKFPFFPFFPFPLREGSFFHLMLQSNNKTTFSATGNPPPPFVTRKNCFSELAFIVTVGIHRVMIKFLAGICISGIRPASGGVNLTKWTSSRFLVNFRAVHIQYSTVQYSTVQYSTVQYSTVQYSTVQYSTVQYSTVQYSTVQYSTVQYSTVQYSTVQYSTVQYSTVQYSTVQYSTVQYSTVQYSTVQYSTVQYSAVWPVDVINTKTGGRCQQFSNDVTFYLIDLSFDIPCVCYFMHNQARYFERYFQAMLRYVIGVPGW